MKKIKKLGLIVLLFLISVSFSKAVDANDSNGTFGKNQKWIYNEKQLYISCDENNKEKVDFVKGQLPWNAYMDNITRVNIMVNYIGDNMFNGCKNLEEVYFNRKVEVISNTAFENCPKLKKVITDIDYKELGDFAKNNGYEYIVQDKNATATKIVKGKVVYKIVGHKAVVVGVKSKKAKTLTIKNSISVKGKKYLVSKIDKNVLNKFAKLKAQADGKGKLTYKVKKCPKKMKKFIKVSKKGTITFKKKAKKGTYKIAIIVSARDGHKKTTKVVTIKVK